MSALGDEAVWRCNPTVTGSKHRREARYGRNNANRKLKLTKTKTDFSYVYVTGKHSAQAPNTVMLNSFVSCRAVFLGLQFSPGP